MDINKAIILSKNKKIDVISEALKAESFGGDIYDKIQTIELQLLGIDDFLKHVNEEDPGFIEDKETAFIIIGDGRRQTVGRYLSKLFPRKKIYSYDPEKGISKKHMSYSKNIIYSKENLEKFSIVVSMYSNIRCKKMLVFNVFSHANINTIYSHFEGMCRNIWMINQKCCISGTSVRKKHIVLPIRHSSDVSHRKFIEIYSTKNM